MTNAIGTSCNILVLDCFSVLVIRAIVSVLVAKNRTFGFPDDKIG